MEQDPGLGPRRDASAGQTAGGPREDGRRPSALRPLEGDLTSEDDRAEPPALTWRSVVGAVATLVGFASGAITLWQILPDTAARVSGVLAYCLALATVGLLVLYRDVRARLLQAEARLATAGEAELLADGMVALLLHIGTEPRADTQHRFTRVLEEYVIQGDDGTFNLTLEGANALPTPSTGVTLKIGGDSAVGDGLLPIFAKDERGDELTVRIDRDHPYVKVFTVEFPEPLKEGEEFSIKISCRWANAFPRTRAFDYVFFPATYYTKHHLGQLRGRVVSDVFLRDVEVHRLEPGTLGREDAQPAAVRATARHFVVEWEPKDPRHVYVLTFHKDLPRSRGTRRRRPWGD